MGLCKCPKRKVTNLFCFEHRVNVCETCLTTNHEACVVQTYVSWLTDSDFDPNCLLCTQTLAGTETVRLKCMHVFHWKCLNGRMSALPIGSNSANYKCPSCLDNLFPALNQGGPVIDKLRTKLSTVNWGRGGIGLDLKPEFETQTAANHSPHPSGRVTPAVVPREREASFLINMEANGTEASSFTSRAKAISDDRKPLLSPEDEPRDEDHPDQKYARRFGGDRHLKIRSVPRNIKRVAAIAIVTAVLIFVFLVMGRFSGDPDKNPLFDPHANPNIRVADS
uniref:Zinc finger protein-like 1 homolog n=1 Tax=Panagrellus redivivus TaxID=6233 RepID=A0A7E4WD72_PANRE